MQAAPLAAQHAIEFPLLSAAHVPDPSAFLFLLLLKPQQQRRRTDHRPMILTDTETRYRKHLRSVRNDRQTLSLGTGDFSVYQKLF